MASTVSDLAQVHIADITCALNKQPSGATDASADNSAATTGGDDEDDVLMNIAVAESLSQVDNGSNNSHDGEEFKESPASESSHTSSASSASCSSASPSPIDAEPVKPVELASEWELVGRVSPSNTVPLASSPPAPFVHGFIAPPVVRPVVPVQSSAESLPIASSSVPVGVSAEPTATLSNDELDEWRAELLLLTNMGFDNSERINALLERHSGDIVAVVSELIN